MSTELKISVGQFATGEDKEASLNAVRKLAKDAADEGARVLVLPESAMYHRVTASVEEAVAEAEPLDGKFAQEILKLSKQYGLFIAAGMSIPAGEGRDQKRAVNVLLLADKGEFVHSYEKIHLYDAFKHKESETVQPGDDLPPVVDIDGHKVGFAICYDLRFPELFRILADEGAEAICLSAAWVKGIMKEDHWLTLLRARAIENTAYVFASGDVSDVSVGRSVIYDPLGLQLGDAGEQKDTNISANVNSQRVDEVRRTVPSLANRRIAVSHRVEPLD
jgi:predicted amidohydrolase